LLLEDLRDAADDGGELLDEDALASLDRGVADVAAGRVTALEEYERKRGL
jgi:predicted transcriptional regulator